MGQIKNIKLHIVTDIKVTTSYIKTTTWQSLVLWYLCSPNKVKFHLKSLFLQYSRLPFVLMSFILYTLTWLRTPDNRTLFTSMPATRLQQNRGVPVVLLLTHPPTHTQTHTHTPTLTHPPTHTSTDTDTH